MITYCIIFVTAIVSYICFSNKVLLDNLKFNAYAIIHKKEYYRLITHLFVHIGWNHLLFNMLTLYFFGLYVESVFANTFYNRGIFLLFYLGGGIFSSLLSLIKQRNNYHYSSVGASGAVSAILYAFILFEPLQKIYLFFIPIGIPAFIFGIIYIGVSIYLSKKNQDNIGHDAHYMGAIYGFLLPILLQTDFFYTFIQKLGRF